MDVTVAMLQDLLSVKCGRTPRFVGDPNNVIKYIDWGGKKQRSEIKEATLYVTDDERAAHSVELLDSRGSGAVIAENPE